MKKTLPRIYFQSILILLLYNPLYAQEASLQEEQRSYIFKLMAATDDTEGKLRILQYLRQEMTNGQIPQTDYRTVNALARLAQQGTAYKIYDAVGNLINDDLAVRAEASNLLGELGGPLAESRLISTMKAEEEPYLTAVAMENLFKVNPEGSPNLVENIVQTFYWHHYNYHSDNLARSFLQVISEYGANSEGKLLSPFVLRAIYEMTLPNSTYATELRLEARKLIWNWIAGKYPALEINARE